MSKESIRRREFLGRLSASSLGAAAVGNMAAQVVPASALGRDGSVAPSNRIGLGFIGVGMMGRGHLRCFLQYPDAQVLAVCDVDRWRREEGWIHVGRQGYLRAYPAEILEHKPGDQDPYWPVSNHHQNWLECIKTRETPACDAAVGCRSTMVAHLGIAHWTGRTLRWDPVKEDFLGDDAANFMRSRSMRAPWRL